MKVKLHRLGKTDELETFVNRMGLDELFDYDAPFIFIYKIDSELVFVNVYKLEKVDDKIMPRFIHILIDKSIRHSKLIIDLAKQAEDMLKLLGYNELFAYILNSNKLMSSLAIKFGYISDRKDSNATYYFKKLDKES
jgi:hypothetical protein